MGRGRKLAQNLTGQRFGLLSVTSYAGGSMWSCSCDCGTPTEVYGASLLRGMTKSCGCLRRRATGIRFTGSTHARPGGTGAKPKHGMHGTREYAIWNAMIQRCLNPNSQSYPNYGGRGITICKSWMQSPRNWLADMGPCPPGHWLDRIDNDGNYEPGNCQWSTPGQQAQNKRPRANIKHRSGPEKALARKKLNL
jgi:hypothetical protein